MILKLCGFRHNVLSSGIITESLTDLLGVQEEKLQGDFYRVDDLVKLGKVFVVSGVFAHAFPEMFNGVEIRRVTWQLVAR